MSQQGGGGQFQPGRQAAGHGFRAGHDDTYFHGAGGGEGDLFYVVTLLLL